MLRQVDVLVGQGKRRIDAIREIGVVEQTYYRWRKQYGGMGANQVSLITHHPRMTIPRTNYTPRHYSIYLF